MTVSTKKNALRLADFIEGHKRPFAMDHSRFDNDEDTGCVAAFAILLWPSVRNDWGTYNDDKLGRKLGIPDSDAIVYHPRTKDGSAVYFDDINRAVAVKMLRRLGNTGELYFDAPDPIESS